MEQRSSRRVATGVGVSYRVEQSDAASRKYLEGLVENYSLGGIFLVTDLPLDRGEVIRLQLVPADEAPVEILAVVRWVRRWKRPRGAGMEFVEFAGLGERDFPELLERLFEPAG